ncbi:uncharacterized protein AB675_3699 [Cyphellophora attinorum]|uniref:Uncharacterized protein n=1 Tax=Cyphellophora attinorum TaxID=1664694 RepID=A0A0N1H5P5_9EURO|nr:uncharacterized protein AB675_3699 [Phialophora attinorum]KPI37147.1 hypothetical protein AB675_3699 [Phialophora attinorum]
MRFLTQLTSATICMILITITASMPLPARCTTSKSAARLVRRESTPSSGMDLADQEMSEIPPHDSVIPHPALVPAQAVSDGSEDPTHDCDQIFAAINLPQNSTLRQRIATQFKPPSATLNQDQPSPPASPAGDFDAFVQECFAQDACFFWDTRQGQVIPTQQIPLPSSTTSMNTDQVGVLIEAVGTVDGVGIMVGVTFVGDKAVPIFLRHSGSFQS